MSQPSDIAEFIRIDRTAASRALRQMEAARLIRREAGQADRRTTRVRVTDIGRAALEKGLVLAAEVEQALTGRLGPERADQLAGALSALVDRDDRPMSQI